jgi:plasmid maintenance system antidote protein VapI
VEIVDKDDDYVDYFESETYKRIREITTGGEMLKAYRERSGLTQRELAKRLGVRQPNVNSMERGKRPIGKGIAGKFAEVHDADRDTFLR